MYIISLLFKSFKILDSLIRKLKYDVSSFSTHAKLKEKKENLQFFLSPIVKENALNLPLHLNSEVRERTL